VSERTAVVEDATMKCGLLMESAQAHQKLAEVALERLRAHTQDLDGVVREAISRTVIEELRALTAESDRACRALRDMQRAVALRTVLWSIGIASLSTGIPLAIARVALPSASSVAALRARQDNLTQNVALLEQRGGRIEWKTCGGDNRLCVRIDKRAPAFGEAADYAVVKGY
jgi:hypothetical protein